MQIAKLPNRPSTGKLVASISALTLPVPALETVSDSFVAGWAFADAFIASGGNMEAQLPADWHEDKVNGFWDRLEADRQRGGVCAAAVSA